MNEMNDQDVKDSKINMEESKESAKKEVKPKESKKKEKHDKEKEALRLANIELNDKLLRVSAEMQNIKRRSEIDLANAYKYDGIDLVEKMLPIIDNFERALSIKQEGTEKFLSGFKMIYDNLIKILNEKGITEIDAMGKAFDPNIMNAVITDKDENQENNIVLDVLQKGYQYNEKIIRPAMVKVNERESD